jgi:ankyrin repeat protein
VHDRRGLTAVHYCVRENLPECLLEFLKGRSIENMKKNGSNSEATDCGAILSAQGQTLMHTACKHGAEACANMLAKWHAGMTT